LLKEARNGNSSDSALPAQHGKKRAFSRSSSPSQREAKRLKTSFLSANESASAEASLSRIDFVPVYHHLAEIQYTLACLTLNQNDYTHEDDPAYLQWFEEEKRLLELLDGMFNGAPEPETVELGTVTFREYHGRLVALSFPESLTDDFDFYTHPRWLLLVPPFSQEIDLEAYDYVSPNMEDILIACHRLKLFGRAKIDAHVKLTYLPFGTYDKNKNELPFCLHTDITVSLIPSALSTPIPNHVKPRTIRLEDAQRRFLDFLFPINSSMSYDGETNIPFFYSILRPAPQLQSNFVEDVMQPDSLRPTLLPFQRRGVGWMLEREGKLVTPQGKINPVATNSQLPLFWDRVQEGTNTWYINRLSGAFSQSPPYGSLPFGGILAEEQGLGKTLECIALILLNPDPSRNPTLKRWDPEARLTIKQIKVSSVLLDSGWI
jgi:E3 ubiquitin-protein ligase SHPRH